MLKIMSFQSINNGYSSTKLSIIKAINDIESNKQLFSEEEFNELLQKAQELSEAED